MREIKTPGGGPTVIHTGTDEEAAKLEALLEKRHRFVIAYSKEKGWPSLATELSIKQILEIRKQPGWQDEAIPAKKED